MKGQELITGMLLGAGTMYLLDPDRGTRRRSLLRDQGVHAGHKLGEGLAATARDARNRTRGVAAELRSRLGKDQPDDEILHERVRSAIGRVVTHPSAITVIVDQGRITLAGHVLANEVDDLVKQVKRVRGVEEVRNELEMHRTSDGVPALQGSGRLRQQRPELLQENWSPTTRVLAGALGATLALQGTRKSVAGNVLGTIGLGLLARAVTNLPASRLVGVGADHAGIDIQKTINVAAPVDRVWDLWSHFENFPRFMAHVREVQKIDNVRSRWVAAGPAGVPVEWEAVVTDWVPNQLIAWKSVEGSVLDTVGSVRFQPVDDGTRIDIRFSYTPPAGAFGHAVASLFGADPKQAMDEDMVRLKSLLEAGKTRAEGDQVQAEEILSRR
jgi:uncharacterized membrane protein